MTATHRGDPSCCLWTRLCSCLATSELAAGPRWWRARMVEPSREELARAFAALTPFVAAYGLPVNPEELEEMAYAVLAHVASSEALVEIHDAVERQIAEAHPALIVDRASVWVPRQECLVRLRRVRGQIHRVGMGRAAQLDRDPDPVSGRRRLL